MSADETLRCFRLASSSCARRGSRRSRTPPPPHLDGFYSGEILSSSALASSSRQDDASNSSSKGKGKDKARGWSFASKALTSERERALLEQARDSVDLMTNRTSRGAEEARRRERELARGTGGSRGVGAADGDDDGRDVGPSLPPREQDRERERGVRHTPHTLRQAELSSRAQERRAASERLAALQEAHDPQEGRATGREAQMERRRERNAEHQAFARRKEEEDGLEMSDEALGLGLDAGPAPAHGGALAGGPGAAGAAAAGGGRRSGKERWREERQAEMNVRVDALRQKDQKTMEMFKALAAQRFGGGGGGAGAGES